VAYAGAIYGTIVATAVVEGLSEDPEASSMDIVVATIGTTVVFWLAHVYANVLGRRAEIRRPPTWDEAWTVARDEWPMVEAGVIIAVPSLLAAAGLLSHDTGVNLAIFLGIAILFGCGLLLARREGLRWGGALLAAAISGALGLVIVGLKTLVH
jgi:hypothetical protein